MTHTVLMTGATGYLGGYVCRDLLRDPKVRLALLVRGKDRTEQLTKLWNSWQLHLSEAEFLEALPRVHMVRADLHADDLGISQAGRAALRDQVDSVLHVAATLNRKSPTACFQTNLRGTLSVIQLARWLHDRRGLEHVSFVSTAAVAGKRQGEDLGEDEAYEASRSQLDPYARSKGFCEHMLTTLLPDLPTTIFRPSIVMGDGSHPRTSQFDMIFATCMLADLPALPLPPEARVDIANAAWVGGAIAKLHMDPHPHHRCFHLSAGAASPTVQQITDALDAHRGTRTRFAPALGTAWDWSTRLANRAPRGTSLRGLGSLWKVFWPYVTYDTVFDNDRAVEVMGQGPVPFPSYFPALYDWVKTHQFRYPHLPLPGGAA